MNFETPFGFTLREFNERAGDVAGNGLTIQVRLSRFRMNGLTSILNGFDIFKAREF